MSKIKFLSYLFTVISFLLIIIEGEKIAGFGFMYLLWLPFAVINGWSNIFSLNYNKGLIILIDMIYFILLYISIFHLLRTYYYKIISKKSYLFNVCSILILQLQAMQFFPKNLVEFSSIVTLGFFFTISTISIFLTFLSSKS